MPHDPADTITALHSAIDAEARRLHVLHAERLHCKRGCAACCVDELTVSVGEAEHIRRHHGALLATGEPHASGACAFLDAEGACRIYGARPYVCRTQGLPLRWLADDEQELRDICPLNEAGVPIEALAAQDCWTLGPVEERLARIQMAKAAPSDRIPLRALFRVRERR